MSDNFDQALRELRAAHDRAVAAVRAAVGAAAFHMATALRDEMERLADGDAGVRAEIADRIAQAQRLSLQGLADKLDLSKPRAQQLRARAQKEK